MGEGNSNSHKKKMVAPIIISVAVILIELLYFGVIIWTIDVFWVRVLLPVIPLAIGIAMVCVCRERIKEIKDGVEDDLSEY